MLKHGGLNFAFIPGYGFRMYQKSKKYWMVMTTELLNREYFVALNKEGIIAAHFLKKMKQVK